MSKDFTMSSTEGAGAVGRVPTSSMGVVTSCLDVDIIIACLGESFRLKGRASGRYGAACLGV